MAIWLRRYGNTDHTCGFNGMIINISNSNINIVDIVMNINNNENIPVRMKKSITSCSTPLPLLSLNSCLFPSGKVLRGPKCKAVTLLRHPLTDRYRSIAGANGIHAKVSNISNDQHNINNFNNANNIKHVNDNSNEGNRVANLTLEVFDVSPRRRVVACRAGVLRSMSGFGRPTRR